MNKETAIHQAILLALSQRFHPIGVFYRQNAGRVRNDLGAWVYLGPTGISDIVGLLLGRAIYIEVKTATGRQRPEQKAFQAAVERAGGIYIVARSPGEAIDAVLSAVAPSAHAQMELIALTEAARLALKAAGPTAGGSGGGGRVRSAPTTAPAGTATAPKPKTGRKAQHP